MFSETVMSEIGMVAHQGAENAGRCLSEFLDEPFSVYVTDIAMTPLETIPEKLGSSEMLAIGLISRVKGNIQGNAALLFKEEHALRLVQILGSKEDDIPDDGFADLERSMLEETANITISSFMNSIATHLEKSCIPNAPIYLLDMAGSILAVILMESADVADVALLVSTRFECRNEDLTALFVLLPNPASLHAMVLSHKE